MKKVLWDNYQIGDLIGEGANGKVYKVYKNINGVNKYYAVKYISFPRNNHEIDDLIKRRVIKGVEDANAYYREILDDIKVKIETIKKYGNQYVLNYYDYYEEAHEDGIGYDIYIRMDLVTQSLKDFMNRNMSTKEIIGLGIDVCEGLDSLRKCNIIHGNVKPSNIFIGSDGKYKIGDFKVDNYQSNSLYIAPEVYYQKLVVNKCDTYALGLIMYQLLNKGKLPFVSLFVSDTKALKFRMAGRDMTPIKGVEPELMNIILKACSYTDTYRYNDPYMMANALRHYRDKKYSDKESTLSNLNKTVSIYDTETLVMDTKDTKASSDNKESSSKVKGLIKEKIKGPLVELKDKLLDKQFYIDNTKKIMVIILVILLIFFLKGCVFSTKKCNEGYINNFGVCVRGWYTCREGYTLNEDNKCSKTLKSVDANVKYECDDDYALQDKFCLKNDTIDAIPQYQCAGLGRLEGDKCVTEQSTKAAITYECPSGYVFYDDKCSTVSTKTASSSYSCPSGYTLSNQKCVKTEYSNPSVSSGGYECSSNESLIGNKCYVQATCTTTGSDNPYCKWYPYMPGCSETTTSCTCPSGYTKSGTQCFRDASKKSDNQSCSKGTLVNGKCVTTTEIPAIVKYNCPSGYQTYGNQCLKSSSVKPTAKYYCAGGLELQGDNCVATITTDAISGYTCSDGYILAGNTCVLNDKKDAKVEYSCSKVYTLNGDKCEKYQLTNPIKHFGTKS